MFGERFVRSALNEKGSREDDVRLHGSHGESEIFSSRAPRRCTFWAVPSQRRRLTDSCAHETSCFGAWQLAWPPSRCRAHSSRPPLDPYRKTRGPCRYFWTDVASRVNEYETSPLRMTKLFDAAKQQQYSFLFTVSHSANRPCLPARAGESRTRFFSAHEGECFDGQ